jgi:hypothetical protein
MVPARRAAVDLARVLAQGLAVVLALGACGAPPQSAARPADVPPAVAADPARRLHGHNDYLQPVPLLRALELGLGSVEADVWLEAGELRIGHERWQLRPGRTLRSLYLEPLRSHVATNGGRVHPGAGAAGAPFVLLVDVKANGEDVWPVLHAELAEHRTMLTRFAGDTVDPGAVTVVLSGSRPRALVAAAQERFCALDGRLADLAAQPPPPASLVPWISDAWSRVSDWTGADDLLPAERVRIAALVAQAHSQGRELRFWGAPDRPEAWQALWELGVDRIGTDRPKVAAAFLRDR